MKLYFWLTSFLLWSPHLSVVVDAQQQQQQQRRKQQREQQREQRRQREREQSQQSQFNYEDYIPKGEQAEKLVQMFSFGPRHIFEGLLNTLRISFPMIIVGTVSFIGLPLYAMFGNLNRNNNLESSTSTSTSSTSSKRRNKNRNKNKNSLDNYLDNIDNIDNNDSSSSSTTTTTEPVSLGKRIIAIIITSIIGTIVGGGCYLIGTIFAIWQLLVGLFRTPKTVWSWMNGKTYWKDNSWQKYNLTFHAEELEQKKSVTRNNNADAADDSLYKVLDVTPTATSKEIKRAYYKLAKELHPDKQPDKEDEFRKVHAAYETLYDEESRKTYDEWGFASTSNDKQMPFDPIIFFDVLFGTSPELENYIGDLGIKSFATSLCKLVFMSAAQNNQQDGSSDSEKQQQMMQNLLKGIFSSHNVESRQIDIAIWIRDFTSQYVNGTISQDEFQLIVDEHTIQVEESTPFPIFFLETIGKSLYWEGKGYVSISTPLHIPYSIMSTIRSFGITIDTMRFYLIKIYYLNNEFWKRYDELKLESRDSDDDKKLYNKIFLDMVPELLEYVWRYNQSDIIKTIKGACWKLLHDQSDDSNNNGKQRQRKRKRRQAKALEILGNSFLKIVKLNQQECTNNSDGSDGSNSNNSNKGGRRSSSSSSFMNDTDRVKIAIQMATTKTNNNYDDENENDESE